VIIAAGATLRVNGNYTQSATGTLDVQLGGPPPSGQFSKLIVGGTATLAGTLQVDLVNGYGGNPGDVFTILTFGSRMGDFNDPPILPPGAVWDVNTGTVRFF
jgi:outer membrane autotransporter protein